MQVLAFDSATSACSCALWRDGDIVAHRFETMVRGHGERLMGMVRAVMADADADFADIDLIAVTHGPGGFTGLRISLAAARGLALAGNLPCLGVSTLEAVAAGVPDSEGEGACVLAAIDSKRGDIYAQIFSGADPLADAEAMPPENLAGLLNARETPSGGPVVVVGDAMERAIAALRDDGVDAVASAAPPLPDARTVAAMAAARWSPENSTESLRPLYLRSPDAIVPQNGGRLRP
ncbi:MAG: tRNA (adenosine(37)-N6)-threonylcarbamoyltransferase complex dimerization subunit type 1 TsaB [Alphaproteobacteria bacterium]|jgi:tRNA threonylcarbamoyladenosine biosynthesis protein TsaB|nr:tRNA (adenosine(37)-N6)-threonylcarbamoyltransferase complex dimerization subunit type 1 TsaB [Alphaproteobacteria bacterium]MBT7943539.1 tRNA (adenosine(37)-N6)-threonylcarbamoyltransferase complex dimerization subunit type 1 TsaB [Alphaproteobacteria bacterium]